ncbi:hypothetical protein [Frankia sp. Cas4]|uniref:hypothetical protein n=1 Tax=Frankia sp. Cas4 TaxID=3073927 RepID=UPI002AD3861A|nr:hypothetical protein [Frankia sp. Cas4]
MNVLVSDLLANLPGIRPLVTIDNSPVTDAVEKITGRPARSFAAFLAATAATDI